MFRLLTIAFASALLSACAGQAPAPTPVSTVEPATATPAPTAAAVPERSFPADSIYPLLVAEFALRRRAYDVALDNYLEQSERLRDAGVSAHTTHLTQFMQREAEALQAVQLWVELEPDNVEANNTLSNLLVRQGKSLEALPHMALVQRNGVEANFPSLLAGLDQLDDQQRAQLVQGINELAVEFPDNQQILLTQALIHAEFKQYQEALDKLEKLFAIEPYNNKAVVLEAKVLLASGSKKPYQRIERALEQEPENKTLRLQYARMLTVHDMAAARTQFEILSAQSPRDGDLLLSLALINREVGDDIAAKAYLRQLLALEQRINEAHYYLGRIAEDDGELQTALTEYRQVEEGREYISANSHIGQILVKAGQAEQAHAWFQQQRNANPARREQLYALEADILTKAGQNEAAMAVLNEALVSYPDSATLRYARSMLGEQADNLELMESDLRAIIARDPNNATALNALGYTLANRTERYDEAYELISKAHALQPEEPAILDSMGWVLYRKGQYAEAVDYLTRAYAAFPDPEVAAHLGEVLWVSGDTGAATAIWRTALAKDPDHEILLATLKRFGMSELASTAGPGDNPVGTTP